MRPSADLASFVMAGFESSTHRRRDGCRLDVTASTLHDRFCDLDYARLRQVGIGVARESIRWPLVEPRPFVYRFAPLRPMMAAARRHRIQIIWDLCHFGWPDDLDPFGPAFTDRLAALATAFTRVLVAESEEAPYVVPLNEISFVAWAGGDVGYLNPFAIARGDELKRSLVRGAIAASDAVLSVAPLARLVHVDPVIHIAPASSAADDVAAAAGYTASQFEAWDMIAGVREPGLGGARRYLDIVGANFYPRNEWVHADEPMDPSHPSYRPLRCLLRDLWERYGRPVLVTETGTEDEARAAWLRRMADEVEAARADGVPVEGLCLYPVLNHPGWDDDRHCHNGLWDYADRDGERAVHAPLLHEVRRIARRTRDETPS